MRAAADGQTLLLELADPAVAQVTPVEKAGGGLVRLYVDLPAGSRAEPGLGRGIRAEPIAAARVGQGDGGGVRVAVELEHAAAWRMRRESAGRVVALTVTRARAEPRDAPPASPAPAPRAMAPTPTVAGTRPGEPTAPDTPAPGALAAASRTDQGLSGRPKIVLDPGHGGDDPGAIGFSIEKDVTLDIAEQVATLLRIHHGAEVVLTRTGDSTLPLGARTARANREEADLFVSIHANANPTGTLQGVETYVLNDSTDHAVLRLASMENGLDMLGPDRSQTDLRYILSDLVQGGKMDESVALAAAIQRELVGGLRGDYPDVVDLGVKRGPFYVLVGAYMPCVLVETSFVTHPVEGRRLAQAEYRTAVAEGIVAGISRFLRDGTRTKTL